MQLNIKLIQNSVSPQLSGILRALGLQGRRRVLMGAGQEFIKMIKSNFGGGGSMYRAEGQKWAPYSKSYAKIKGKSQPDLVKTGALMNSFQMASPRKSYVEVFTKNPYAAAIAYGYKPRNLPPRQYFPIQSYNKSYNRLSFNAEKNIIFELGKRFTILSGGALPRLSPSIIRSLPTYGSPFTGPQASE